jgi:hypothetical protein
VSGKGILRPLKYGAGLSGGAARRNTRLLNTLNTAAATSTRRLSSASQPHHASKQSIHRHHQTYYKLTKVAKKLAFGPLREAGVNSYWDATGANPGHKTVLFRLLSRGFKEV